ncbi:hypothetical protein BC629DRAFT_1474512 [Irpex lacteus]|nr:hypothetical protein BC629DRAFT_1474512 [Irpex lacteus]
MMTSPLCATAGLGADTDSAYDSAYQQRLNTSRNAQAPISKLPAEMMCRIFRLCAPSLENINLALSQVCTRWRELALCDPYLWRTPILCRPKLASMMLSRAKSVPLLVESGGDRWTEHGDVHLGIVETALRQCAVTSLTLAARLLDLRASMELLTNKSSHTLEHLHITRTFEYHSPLDDRTESYLHIPTRALRTLHLVECVPYPSSPFSALVSVHINLGGYQACKMNTNTLIQLLRGSPNLETLALLNTLTSIEASSEASFISRCDLPPQLSLLHLKTLELHDTLCCLLLATSAMDFPSLRVANVRMGDTDCAEDQIQPLLQLLVYKLTAYDPWSGGVERISYDVGNLSAGIIYLLVEFYGTTSQVHDTGLSANAPRKGTFRACIFQHQSPLNWNAWPSLLLGCFSLQKLHHVSVESDQGRHLQHIRAVLELVPQTISEIEVHGYAYLELLGLWPCKDSLASFPNVKEIRIRNADLTMAHIKWFDALEEFVTFSNLDLLAEILARWAEQRKQRLKVVFSGCTVPYPARYVLTGRSGIEVEESDECVVRRFEFEDEEDEDGEDEVEEDEDEEDEEDDGEEEEDEDEDEDEEDEDENDEDEDDEENESDEEAKSDVAQEPEE